MRKLMRNYFTLTLLFALLLTLAACSIADPSLRSTQQAQETQIAVRATRMALSGVQTKAVQDRQATSTARAYYSLKVQASAWPNVLTDNFANNLNKWPVGPEDSELQTIDLQVKNGVFHIEATAKQGFVYWTVPDDTEAQDFYLSVKAQVVTGTLTADYGLVFRRVDNDNYYLFEIDNNRQYAVLQLLKGEWHILIDWTESRMITPFEWNTLAVIGQGDLFLFFVNEQMVAQLNNDSFPSGSYGTVVGLDELGDAGTFEFDDFSLHSPNPPPTETP